MTDKMLSRKEGGIGYVIFNNPERHNAVSMEMWAATRTILDQFRDDADVRAVAAGFLGRAIRVVAVGGVADGKRLGDGARAHRHQHVGVVADHGDDRPAAGRLTQVELSS